jgi:AraC family transcriptional regulator
MGVIMVPQTTTSRGLEAYLANPSRRFGADEGWTPLVVRSRVEPDRQDYLFLPATPDPWIVAVISGQRRIEVKRGGRWHGGRSGPGQVGITGPGSTNEIRWRSEGMEPIETVHICLDHGFISKLSSELGCDACPEIRNMLAEQDPVLAHLAGLLRHELRESSSTWTGLVVEAAAQLLGMRLLAKYSSRPVIGGPPKGGLSRSQMRRIADYVEANLRSPMRLHDLAAVAGVSPYHFARMFKRSNGMTPHQFVANAKFELARRLLLEKQWTIRRIAHNLGFASAAHFSVVFKSRVGRTPNEFRKDRL